MNAHTNRALMALAILTGVSACGESTPTDETATEVAATEPVRTCENIREQVILLSERNVAANVNTIIKIYDPKTVKAEPGKVSCSGRAILSNAEETTVYYRAYQDSDGEWLIEFNEKPLEK